MDYNLILRDGSAHLLGDETLTDMELLPMVQPLYLHILVPEVSASDTLDVTADFENVSNTTLQQTTIPQITAAGKYVVPLFCDHPDLTDLSVILNTTEVGGGTFDFGHVKVWVSTSRLN